MERNVLSFLLPVSAFLFHCTTLWLYLEYTESNDARLIVHKLLKVWNQAWPVFRQ